MDLPALLYVCYFEPCLRKRKRPLSEGIRQLVSGFLARVQNAIVTTTAAVAAGAAGSRTLFVVVEIIYGY
jgi:hypothetical protein